MLKNLPMDDLRYKLNLQVSLGLEKLSASSSIINNPYYFAQTIISVLSNFDPKTYDSIIPLVYLNKIFILIY